MIYAICFAGLCVAVWQEVAEHRRISLMAKKFARLAQEARQ